MSDSLNANASLPVDDVEDTVDAGLGERPVSPDVIHSEQGTPAVDEDHVPEGAEQGSDIEIIAALESLDTIRELYASLESAGTINRAFATDIHHRVPGIQMYSPAYYTEKPSKTHYEASLEALVVASNLVVSQEGVISNSYLDGLRNFTESFSNMTNRLDKAGKRLKEQVAKLRSDGTDFHGFTIDNASIVKVLSATGESTSTGELFAQTEGLVDYLDGSIKRLTDKNEVVSKVKSNDIKEVEPIFNVFLTIPKESDYGSRNKWVDKKQVSNKVTRFKSTPLAGQLQLQYDIPTSADVMKLAPALATFTVKNVGKVETRDGKIEVPDSQALFNFLDKIADRLIKLAADRRVERSAVWTKGKMENSQFTKLVTGKFNAARFFVGLTNNRANIFYRETGFCAVALTKVVGAWLTVLKLGAKSETKVSNENLDSLDFVLANDENQLFSPEGEDNGDQSTGINTVSEFSLGIGDDEALKPDLNDDDFVADRDGVLEQGSAQIVSDMDQYISLEALRDRIQGLEGVSVGIALECLKADSSLAIPNYLDYTNSLSNKHYEVTVESIEASMESIWSKIKSVWNNIKASVTDTLKDARKVALDIQSELGTLLAEFKARGKKGKIELVCSSDEDAQILSAPNKTLQAALEDLNDFYATVSKRQIGKVDLFNEAIDNPKDFDLGKAFAYFATPNWKVYNAPFTIAVEKEVEVVTFSPLIGGAQFIYNSGYRPKKYTVDLKAVNVEVKQVVDKSAKKGDKFEISLSELKEILSNIDKFAGNLKAGKGYADWASQEAVFFHGVNLSGSRNDNESNAGYFISMVSLRSSVHFLKESKLMHKHYLKVMRAFIRLLKANVK